MPDAFSMNDRFCKIGRKNVMSHQHSVLNDACLISFRRRDVLLSPTNSGADLFDLAERRTFGKVNAVGRAGYAVMPLLRHPDENPRERIRQADLYGILAAGFRYPGCQMGPDVYPERGRVCVPSDRPYPAIIACPAISMERCSPAILTMSRGKLAFRA